MTRRRPTIGAALLAAALTTLVMVPPASADDAAPGAADGPTAEQQKLETWLMKYIVTQHEFEIRFAQLCIDKASRNELVAECESIKEEATEGRDKLRGYLQDWYGTDQALIVKEKQYVVLALVGMLQGDRFEYAVSLGTVWHDVRGITDALTCQRKVYHDDLRAHCRVMYQSFAEHVDRLEQILIDIGYVPSQAGNTAVEAA